MLATATRIDKLPVLLGLTLPMRIIISPNISKLNDIRLS
jgi:hypothetical protein